MLFQGSWWVCHLTCNVYHESLVLNDIFDMHHVRVPIKPHYFSMYWEVARSCLQSTSSAIEKFTLHASKGSSTIELHLHTYHIVIEDYNQTKRCFLWETGYVAPL